MSHDRPKYPIFRNSMSGSSYNPISSSKRSSSNSSNNTHASGDLNWYEKHNNVSEELRKARLIYQDTDSQYKLLYNGHERVSKDYDILLKENGELKKYRDKYDRLKHSLTENKRLMKESRESKEVLDESLDRNLILTKEITMLKNENKMLKELYDESLKKNLELVKENSILKDDNNKLKELLERTFEDKLKISKLETELQNVSSDYNNLLREFNKLKEEYSNLRDKYKESRTKQMENVNTINLLKDESQSLMKENTDLKREMNQLKRSSGNLNIKEYFEENVEDESKTSKLETELRKGSSDYNELKRLLNEKQQQYSILEKTYNENKTKESEAMYAINQLKDEIQSLKIENTHLQSEMKNKLKIDAENLILKDRTIDKLENVEQIKMERDRYMKDKAELEKEIEIKTDAIKRMRDKLMAAKKDNEELESLKRYKKEYLYMEKELNETKLLLNEAKKQNEKLERDRFMEDEGELEKEKEITEAIKRMRDKIMAAKKDNEELEELKRYKTEYLCMENKLNEKKVLLNEAKKQNESTGECSADKRQSIADSKFSSLNVRTTNHPLQEDNCDDNNLPI